MKYAKGICQRDKSLVGANMFCEISRRYDIGFEPSDKFQRKIDKVAGPIGQDLTMREGAQCSTCKYYKEV